MQRDIDSAVTTVTATGELTVRTAPAMRATLMKALAECPAALIVDMTDCDAATPAAITVFASALRLFESQPPVPLLVIDPDGRVRGNGWAVLGPVTCHVTMGEALAVAADTRRRHDRVRIGFRRSLAAPGQGRATVNAACQRWGIGHLSAVAQLIVSELVTNAVIHGGTAVTLEVIRRGAFLHLRVRDGSAQPPVMLADRGQEPSDHGRGLPIIRGLCTGWGFVRDDLGDGKVVWATLRIHPLRLAPRSGPV